MSELDHGTLVLREIEYAVLHPQAVLDRVGALKELERSELDGARTQLLLAECRARLSRLVECSALLKKLERADTVGCCPSEWKLAKGLLLCMQGEFHAALALLLPLLGHPVPVSVSARLRLHQRLNRCYDGLHRMEEAGAHALAALDLAEAGSVAETCVHNQLGSST